MSEYADSLVPRIRKILSSSDLSTVSAKGVRKQLVAEGEDADKIKEHRSGIDERIGEIYEELAGEGDDSDEEDEKPLAASVPAPSHPASSQPIPLALPTAALNRKPIKPEQQLSDEAMAKKLQAEYDAATRGGRGERRAAAPATKKKKTTKKKKRSASDVEDSDASGGDKQKKKRGGGGGAFNKELILSDSLSAFLHEEKLSRPQTVKRIWDYVKANDLQDPGDRRFILCDGPMQAVFHTDKLHMFTMNKLLAQHFRDPDEVVKPQKSSP